MPTKILIYNGKFHRKIENPNVEGFTKNQKRLLTLNIVGEWARSISGADVVVVPGGGGGEKSEEDRMWENGGNEEEGEKKENCKEIGPSPGWLWLSENINTR